MTSAIFVDFWHPLLNDGIIFITICFQFWPMFYPLLSSADVVYGQPLFLNKPK